MLSQESSTMGHNLMTGSQIYRTESSGMVLGSKRTGESDPTPRDF